MKKTGKLYTRREQQNKRQRQEHWTWRKPRWLKLEADGVKELREMHLEEEVGTQTRSMQVVDRDQVEVDMASQRHGVDEVAASLRLWQPRAHCQILSAAKTSTTTSTRIQPNGL